MDAWMEQVGRDDGNAECAEYDAQDAYGEALDALYAAVESASLEAYQDARDMIFDAYGVTDRDDLPEDVQRALGRTEGEMLARCYPGARVE